MCFLRLVSICWDVFCFEFPYLWSFSLVFYWVKRFFTRVTILLNTLCYTTFTSMRNNSCHSVYCLMPCLLFFLPLDYFYHQSHDTHRILSKLYPILLRSLQFIIIKAANLSVDRKFNTLAWFLILWLIYIIFYMRE